MREIPKLFSAPMVCAILDQRKTQTRRTADPDAKPGDLIWGREAFSIKGLGWSMKPSQAAKIASKDAWLYRATPPERWSGGWRPSIHMPKAACRLWLPVLDVRREQLHNITETDALAEGVEILAPQPLFRSKPISFRDYNPDKKQRWLCDTAVDSYRTLWNSINGPEAWQLNPIVTVYEWPRLQTYSREEALDWLAENRPNY